MKRVRPLNSNIFALYSSGSIEYFGCKIKLSPIFSIISISPHFQEIVNITLNSIMQKQKNKSRYPTFILEISKNNVVDLTSLNLTRKAQGGTNFYEVAVVIGSSSLNFSTSSSAFVLALI